jgi:hypothetical protein
MAKETLGQRQQRIYNETALREKQKEQIEQRQEKIQRQESYIFGRLLNTTTYMIIFLLLIFGLSAQAYQREPQKYSWLDANGEFKTETYDVTVSYNLDTPLNDLNGYSLKEVFEVYNLQNGYWFTYNSSINSNDQELFNGLWTSQSLAVFSVVRNFYDGDIVVGNSYYVNGSIRTISQNVERIQIEKIGLFQVFYPVVNQWYDYSFVNTVIQYGDEFRAAVKMSVPTSGIVGEITKPLIIDLTALGINQTKDEMDYWYSEYQRLQENRINDMKNLGQYAISSWTTTTEILKSIGQALNSVYETMPVSWLLDWILDISL